MATAARVPLSGPRTAPFVVTFRFKGINLTGAIFGGQVRERPDEPGTPLLVLPTVGAADATGFRLSGVSVIDGSAVSFVTMTISELDMRKMPDADAIGEDVDVAWDMHVTPAGGIKQRRFHGPFTVEATATVGA